MLKSYKYECDVCGNYIWVESLTGYTLDDFGRRLHVPEGWATQHQWRDGNEYVKDICSIECVIKDFKGI